MGSEWLMPLLTFLGLLQTLFMAIIGYIFQQIKLTNDRQIRAGDMQAKVSKEIYSRIEDLMKELHRTQVELYQYYALKADLEKHEQEGRERISRLHERIDAINTKGCIKYSRSHENGKT